MTYSIHRLILSLIEIRYEVAYPVLTLLISHCVLLFQLDVFTSSFSSSSVLLIPSEGSLPHVCFKEFSYTIPHLHTGL